MANRAPCIGVNDYPGSGMDLRGCVNDAKDWPRCWMGVATPSRVRRPTTSMPRVHARASCRWATGCRKRPCRARSASASYADWRRQISEHLPSASFPQSPQLIGNAAVNKRKVLA